jgi:hypothetical protein
MSHIKGDTGFLDLGNRPSRSPPSLALYSTRPDLEVTCIARLEDVNPCSRLSRCIKPSVCCPRLNSDTPSTQKALKKREAFIEQRRCSPGQLTKGVEGFKPSKGRILRLFVAHLLFQPGRLKDELQEFLSVPKAADL